MTTLTSLISEQLIPNLLFIKEKEHEVKQHLFVTTSFMEGKGASDRLAKVAGLKPGTWQKVVVVEDSLEDIRQKLEALHLPGDGKYLLNLTGGTKIMSIGVNRFFEAYQLEAYYATLGKNTYKKIFPADANVEDKTFRYQLSLREYLLAYGFEVVSEGLPAWATEELADRFYRYNRSYQQREAVKELILWQQRNRESSFALGDDARIGQLVDVHGWKPLKTARLSPVEIQFLISGWWEVYVYHKFKSALQLPEGAIGTNCQIVKEGKVPNELDVAFVRNNKLFVAECKTGFGAAKFQEEFNKAIYKLAAIRNDMGLRIPGFLCMLDPNLREKGQVKKHLTERAAIMDTTLVDKVVLKDVGAWQSVLGRIN